MENCKQTILNHLHEIGNGRCSITESVISAEDDPDVREILTRLLKMHEDTRYRDEQAAVHSRHMANSEKRFRGAFENTGVGMAMADRSGRFRRVNASMRKICGYSEAELLSLTFFDLVYPGDLNYFRGLHERLYNGEIPEGFFLAETRCIHKDGSIAWALANVALLSENDGDDVYTIAHLEDITERRMIDEKLKQSENRLVLQINRTPLGVIYWDANFKVREWNPAAETIFGFASEEAVGRHASELIVPVEAREQVDEVWQELLNNRGGSYAVNQNIRKDGAKITCEWHNSPLINDDGEVFGVSSFVRDISMRINIEEALRASEERWQSLAAASFEGVLIHDSGVILDANERLAMMFDCNHSDLVGARVLDLIAAENRSQVQDNLLWLVDATFEATGLGKDGSEFPIEISSRGIAYRGATQRAVVIRDLSQYKQTENALRQEKERAEKALTELAYQKAALDQHAIVAITDPSGIITYANDKFCVISGYEREELIGNSHSVVKSGLHPVSFFKNLWETISSGQVWRSEVVNRAKDGSLYWVDTTIVPFRGVDGEIQQYVAIRNDITELKQTEQALRTSEELFYKAFSASPALNAILEFETTRMINVNDTWLDFMGMKRDEVIGKTVAEIGFWADPGSRLDFIDTLERDGVVRDREIRVRTNSGELRDLLIAADIVEFAGMKCMMVVSLDIGERKKTENLEARLGRVVEGSLNEIYVFTVDTMRFTQVNKGARENLGYSSAELLGMTPLDIKPQVSAPEFEALVKRLRDSRQDEISFETVHRRKDGTIYEVAIRLCYLRDETPPVFIAFVEDISDRKVAEEVARRSQKIEAVGHLTGGIAHDFNNLLGIILGNLDLLEEELTASQDLAPLVRTAQRAALRGSEMTKRLLSFSSKTAPRTISVNINDSIISMAPLIDRSLSQEIEVVNELSGNLWNTLINDGDFEDAILNLAINAHKAMPDGGKLTFRTENSVIGRYTAAAPSAIKPGEYVHLSVSDTGTGIARDIIDKIFDPFFTTDGQGAGTGLGLSMVYGFVERSGGSISVQSEAGRGATFNIYLPRDILAEVARENNSEEESPVAMGHETILVVDDEPDLVELAKGILGKHGYNVLTAGNAEQALHILDESGVGKIDLLFSDIVMPGSMNGLELARAALARDPGLRVLMATGYMQKVTDADMYTDITGTLLSKPYSKTDLTQGIRAALDGIR